MKLIFETTTTVGGAPVDPPHRIETVAKSIVIQCEYDEAGEHGGAEHTWLVIRNAGNNHEIARMWEIGSWWNVGEYCYDNLRIEE